MAKVDKKSITIWSLETLTPVLISELIAAICFYFFTEYSFISKLCILVFIGGFLYLMWDCLQNVLLYRWYEYRLNEDTLYIRKGGFSISETLIPFKRIQHIDIEQTFYSRLFNLYQVGIFTAGDTHSIGYLGKEEASELKDTLLDYLISIGVDIDE
ncbi:PH domain-containing protein [Bacillus atrophaeus]|uniref:PH domain-containing protein n=1 Tax=Bacillus atrophaeus TaxID=1452 RepID=UPI001C10B3D3|nr:PH domain-containing protein [Bacillus atrophaeus]MBU5262188.1 PH domain-containing protein [Bacillus atrophaeus]MCY8467321.1 PH domain-containing protein [Bacillus atrophaeus]MCY8479941.1 PH domain-containing protein [Bacillus atrophaeus]